MPRSPCAQLPVEECLLSKTCQWTKASTRAKPHCRQIKAWTDSSNRNNGNLQEFTQYLKAWREKHPDVPFREAQKKASENWHKERGTTKARDGKWKENPLYNQQYGGYISDEAKKFFYELIPLVIEVNPDYGQDLYDEYWISTDEALADGIAESLREIHHLTGKKLYENEAQRYLKELGHNGKIW